VPAFLDRLETLPRTLVHGDACPQNLLVDAADPDRFVVIDWSWSGAQPVGFDLAQLLAGGGDTGRLGPAELAAVHATILPAWVEGFRAEGRTVTEAEAEFGYVATLVIFSGLSAIPLDLLGQEPTPELARLFAARLAYGRFIADLGLQL
jgi:Ser/Thr protein kinase RdoA (MazF antagonist)